MELPTSHPLAGSPPALDLDWSGAAQMIAGSENYYICTVGPNRAPHVVPVLGLWFDRTVVFNTQTRARKCRHLVANPAVAVTVAGEDYDFTIEGAAERLTDAGVLERVAAAFPAKYPWWHPSVRDGEFFADDSDEPRTLFAVRPANVFGFGKAEGFSATRWAFEG